MKRETMNLKCPACGIDILLAVYTLRNKRRGSETKIYIIVGNGKESITKIITVPFLKG